MHATEMFTDLHADPLKFVVVDRTPGCDNKYVFDPQTCDKRESWLRQINSLLNMQGDFLKGERHFESTPYENK